MGLAVNCLANIVTKDLARDLLQDSVLLMSHSKPYVRKKAVSAMFKLFVKRASRAESFDAVRPRSLAGRRPRGGVPSENGGDRSRTRRAGTPRV